MRYKLTSLLSALLTATHCQAIPAGWTDAGLVPAGEILELTLALKQQNLKYLEQLFWEVSDPQHPRYGKYLSLEAIAKIISPSSGSLNAVMTWARRAGAFDINVHSTHDYVSMKLNASIVSAVFSADLRRYIAFGGRTEAVRALEGYNLPVDLHDHVESVFPLSELNAAKRRLRTKHRKTKSARLSRNTSWPSDCSTSGAAGHFDVDYPITPEVVYQAYNISSASRATKLGSMAVAGSEDYEDQFNPSDVNLFARSCKLPPLNFSDYGNGKVPDRSKCAHDGKYECGEGTLDMTNEHLCAPSVSMQYWTVKHDDYLSWMVQVNNEPKAALVHSMSSGDLEEDVPAKLRRRVDTEFIKGGLRGLTFLFSSGDSGPWDAVSLADADAGSKNHGRFKPVYPAASPYVTGVGGTEFGTCGQVGAEVAVRVESPCYDDPHTSDTAGYSGGGFSDHYSPPAYMSKFLQAWMHEAKQAGELPPAAYWNQSGAGYPDVSALGIAENIMGGQWDFSGGTSSSSPFFAGIVALLNGARLARGMPPMGFINPWLYTVAAEHAHAFHDITKGNNYFHKKKKLGYVARKGWDPVTGLGTPNVGVLIELAVRQYAPSAPSFSIVV